MNAKLTKFVQAAGWAAKLAPSELSQSLANLSTNDKRVLVGMQTSDDASAFSISKKKALIQSVDFITPLVDTPFEFGQIAAANALSDIFAMGAKFLNAQNIVGFDNCNHSFEVLKEILRGGSDKIKEAKGVLTGGHTITTSQMYYGLCVSGIVKKNKIWRNNTAKVGDVLILTKPLGMGVISTAIKADLANKNEIDEAIKYLSRLNMYACECAKRYKINACTDITGFGFLGHIKEMANENITIVIKKDSVPILKSAKIHANSGLIPEGSYKNYEFTKKFVTCKDEVDILFFDAQTSGGLVLAVDEKDALKLLKDIQNNGDEKANIIGYTQNSSTDTIKII